MAAFLLRSLLSDPSFTETFGFGSSKPGPTMDWKETPEAHIFKFDLPGRVKDDVKIHVRDDRVLHVSAVSKEEEDNGENKSNYKWHCKERVRAGSFCREFRLPENCLVDEIKASMSDGVLVVTVAKDLNKKVKKHAEKHAVEISGEGDDSGSAAAKGFARFVCCKA
ncbi:hypothetical protein ABFX02_13G141500 [Erythranthe guttata]